MQKNCNNQNAFTLVEVMVALTLLTLGLSALLSGLISSLALHKVTKEESLALNGLRAKVEELEEVANSAEFENMLATYLTAAEANFTIDGLNSQVGDVDGVGKVIFPMTGTELQENANLPEFGMPRDLNGDGDTNDTVTSDYVVLPVIVRAEWRGSHDRSREFVILLTNRNQPDP